MSRCTGWMRSIRLGVAVSETEIPSRDTQLDRIEAGINQLNERMGRMEERQNNHGATLESHASQLGEHSVRIRSVELQHAVAAASSTQTSTTLNGRWAAVGAVALVILAAIGGYVGRLIAP